jgi:hypothetical protein
MEDVTTKGRSLLRARLSAITTGVLFFVPGFVFSLPVTCTWANHHWAGEAQASLGAIFPSFVVGVLAAIACTIYLLVKTNSKMSVTQLTTVPKSNSGTRHWPTAMIVLIIVGLVVLGWIAIYYFRGSLMLGYVDSAIGSMRAIVAAEGRFAEAHPGLGYTCALSELPPDRLIGRLVNSGNRNGYAFEISGCQVGGKDPNKRFQVTARPLHKQMPAFCSDQSGILRSDESGSPAKCLESGVPL